MRTKRGIQFCKSAFIPQPWQPLRIFLKASAHCLYPFRIASYRTLPAVNAMGTMIPTLVRV